MFKKETRINKSVSRENLSDELNMKHMPDSHRPVLMHVILEYIKLMEDDRNSIHLS